MTGVTNSTNSKQPVAQATSPDKTKSSSATASANDTRSLGRRIKERLMAILNFLHKHTVLRFRARRNNLDLEQLAKDEPLFEIPDSTNKPAKPPAKA